MSASGDELYKGRHDYKSRCALQKHWIK